MSTFFHAWADAIRANNGAPAPPLEDDGGLLPPTPYGLGAIQGQIYSTLSGSADPVTSKKTLVPIVKKKKSYDPSKIRTLTPVQSSSTHGTAQLMAEAHKARSPLRGLKNATNAAATLPQPKSPEAEKSHLVDRSTSFQLPYLFIPSHISSRHRGVRPAHSALASRV
jgi:hypothetical protein